MPIEATFVRSSDRRAGMILEFSTPTGEVTQRPIDLNINTRQFVAKMEITSEPGAGPLAVQKTQGEAFGPIVLNFGAKPGNGHLLILCMQSPGTITTDMTALGYTKIVGGTNGGMMYFKVAGSNEPQALTVDNNAPTGRMNAVWCEWEQMHASPLGVFASNPSSGDVTSKSSGITGDTVQENNLAVAMFSFGSGSAISGVSWTNGFTTFGAVRNLTVGTALHGVIGPSETTMSWTSGVKTMSGHVVTFKAAQAAAADPSPRQYFSRFVVLETEAQPPLPPGEQPEEALVIRPKWPNGPALN